MPHKNEKEKENIQKPQPKPEHIAIQIDATTNTVNPNENWSGANLETLSQWIQISCLQIEVLDLAIKYFRSIVRKNVLLGLVFSTASGSLSLSQMSDSKERIIYNVIFTIMSFSIAIFTGLIKIYQVQERLEEFIQLKQEWIGFSVVITTEVQLPVGERTMALELITNKEQYLKNLEKYKRLREIACCTDDPSFLEAATNILNEKDQTLSIKPEEVSCEYSNFICICGDKLLNGFITLYKHFFNNKDKYVGEKTALANIILKVVMEEENEQRAEDILRLLNQIKERKRVIEHFITETSIQANKFGVDINKGNLTIQSEMMNI